MPPTQSDASIPVAVPFPSLTAMRSGHGQLLKRQRDTQNSPDFQEEVEAFIQCARATGALLDRDEDRDTAQTLLDYWNTALYRVTRVERPDLMLSEYDPAATIQELRNDEFPYRFTNAHVGGPLTAVGTERLTAEAIKRIDEDNNRLAAIVGPPAHGKSSMTNALLTALQAGATTNSANWHYLPTIIPGPRPLESLAQLFCPSNVGVAEWNQQQGEKFQDDRGHLAKLVEAATGDVPVVVVVDQFEDVFVSCSSNDRDAFVENLFSLIEQPNSVNTLILVMSSDYLGNVERLGRLKDRVQDGLVYVAFTTDEFRQAIEQPAKLVGLEFDDGLVDRLILDVQGDPAALSLLQFTMQKLWDNREGNRITWDKYNRIGGGRLALERAAESAYRNLIVSDQQHVRQVFLTLVKPAVGQHASICDIRREEIYRQFDEPTVVSRIIDQFTAAGLLVEMSEAGETLVAVAHEALVGHWPRLIEWIAEERDEQRRRMRLTEASRAWDSRNHDPEVLWRGSQLVDAQNYADLDELELEFVRASRVAVKEAEQERFAAAEREAKQAHALAAEQRSRADSETKTRKRIQGLLGLLAVALILVAFLASWAILNKGRAEANAKEAKVSADLAEKHAAESKKSSISLTAAHGTVALESGDHPAAGLWFNQALELTGEDGENADQFALRSRIATSLRQQPVLRQVWPARSADFSPDGNSIVVGFTDGDSNAGGFRMHNLNDGQQSNPRFKHDGYAPAWTAFSPDNRWVATAGASSVEIWNAATGKRKWTLFDDPTRRVRRILFSRQGKKFAIAISDPSDNHGQVQAWEIAEIGDTQEFVPQMISTDLKGRVGAISFSHDGLLLAAAVQRKKQDFETVVGHTAASQDRSVDRNATLIDAVGGAFSRRAELEDSVSGHTSMRVGAGNHAVVWDLDTCEENDSNQPLDISMFHRLVINDVAFCPAMIASDAHNETRAYRLATASGSHADRAGEVQLWKLEIDAPMAERVVNSSDAIRESKSNLHQRNKSVLSHVPDTPEKSIAHRNGVRCAAYSPDGRMFLLGDHAGLALLMDTASGRRLATLKHGSSINCAAFGPDGRYVATGSRDRTVRVWDVATGELALRPMWHTAGVGRLRFGPTGRNLLSVSTGTVRLWQLNDDNPPAQLLPVTGTVSEIACSRDCGSLIVVSKRFDDELAACNIWRDFEKQPRSTRLDYIPLDAEPRDPLADRIVRADINEDGQYAVTADHGGTVRHWAHQKNDWKVNWTLSPQTISSVPRDNPTASQPQMKDEIDLVAISPDGLRVAVVFTEARGGESIIQVWDVNTKQVVGTIPVRLLRDSPSESGNSTPQAHTDEVLSVTFSHDGTRVATTGKDDNAFVWTLESGDGDEPYETCGPFRHSADVLHADFSPGGGYLATAGMDQNVFLWKIEKTIQGEESQAAAVLRHESYVSYVRFSRDGVRLVTACNDGRARVWHLPQPHHDADDRDRTPQLVSVLEHGGAIDTVAFSADGKRVTSVGFFEPDVLPRHDGAVTKARRRVSVRVWDLSSEFSCELPTATRVAAARLYDETLDDVEFLSKEDFQKAWDALRRDKTAKRKESSVEAADDEPSSLTDWHRRIAAECELTSRWFAAEWHLTQLIQRNPGDAELYWRRANARAELQYHDKAAHDSRRALQLGFIGSQLLRTYALASLESRAPLDGTKKWKLLCKRILSQHEEILSQTSVENLQDDDLMSANLGVWTCVVTADLDPDDYRRAVRIAEILAEVADKKGIQRGSHVLHRFSNTLGAAYYRAGDHSKALKSLQLSETRYEDLQAAEEHLNAHRFTGKLWNWLFLAMTNVRSGNQPEAWKYMQMAEKVYENRRERPEWFADALAFQQPTWDQRITLKRLYDEATEEIAQSK